MKQDNIRVDKIDANPDNPRGIDIETQDTKQALLRDSIKEFGVLVPLVVIQKGTRFQLVDGERRYVAAKALGMETVPAYITTKSLSNNEVVMLMFHIHHNREQWGPIQQCRALESRYNQIASRNKIKSITNDEAKIKAIAEAISAETGIEFRTAITRVWFLRWPRDIKEKMYESPSDAYWYICEIEDKIIIPALKNYPEYFEKVPVDDVRRDLFLKLEARSVNAATEVRIVAPLTNIPMQKRNDRIKVLNLLEDLRKDHTMTYEEARQEFDMAFPDAVKETPPSPRKILSMIRKLVDAIEIFSPLPKNIIIRRKKEIIQAAQSLKDSLISFLRYLS